MSRSHSRAARWRLANIINRFKRDRSGATAIEFAIVSIPFLGLLFAIFQISFLFFLQQGLDSATATAGRNIMTGQAMTNNYSASDFLSKIVCPALPSFLPCANVIVDVRPATSWSSTNTNQDFLNGSPEFCIGASGSIVIVRIIYPMPSYLSILTMTSAKTFSASTAGQSKDNKTGKMVYPLMGVAAFTNEPFPNNSGYTSPSGC